MAKDIAKHIDEKHWHSKDGGALPLKVLASRLDAVVQAHDKLKQMVRTKEKNMRPISISKEYSGGGGSQGSPVVRETESGVSKTKRKQTTKNSRGEPQDNQPKGPRTRGKALAEAVAKAIEEDSIASILTCLPRDHEGNDPDFNYEESRKVYEEYWSSCTDSYIFGQGAKYTISIDQLETPPETHNIRTLEERGVMKCLHYFLEMPNTDKKMTLCTMPKDLTKKPLSFNEIKEGKFWMINGQHSVEASKRMKNVAGAEKKYEMFKEWECFIVWNKDAQIIRQISAYYNRVNHFQSYMPTWMTNILSARTIWISLGRPAPPKEATELGKVIVKQGKSARDQGMQKKWVVSSIFNSIRVEIVTLV